MKLIEEIFRRNRLLALMGTFFLGLAICLGLYTTINTVQVLGINSMIKPIKFALSTWVYAWTMAYLLFYVNKQNRVKWYSILATVVMLFENGVITIQAFRGKLSHFNQTELIGGILYALMGVMIVWLTIATLIISLRFNVELEYTFRRFTGGSFFGIHSLQIIPLLGYTVSDMLFFVAPLPLDR